MAISNTYRDYCKEPCTLSLDEMQELHHQMIDEIGNDPDALELYDDLVAVATRYASIRASWLSMTREERMEKDSSRTACHNAVIVNVNVLSRYLKMQGKPATWRERLGNEENDKMYRKTIGDFCCYIVFINSICAR